MCLFPLPNTNINGFAYKKGVTEFDCGACPECLRKRSSSWALRAVYESKSHVDNCMVTLTYDQFLRDDRGKRIGNKEQPVNPNIVCDKRHIQLFIKRLRKWYSGISSERIKYIACAEYGSHTHRAHYHLILFGVKFPDIHFYKKSKRGNVIYMSSILTKLWGHGICTVDSICVHSAVARYCTKYCAKGRSNDTFMLCSQSIGLDNLLKDFNGRSYYIDGREYTIPRAVWERYIVNKYSQYSDNMSPKYINRKYDDSRSEVINFDEFERSNLRRAVYRAIRDSDSVYCGYLDYWKAKGSVYAANRPSNLQRIYLLPDSKYHAYKVRALDCESKRRNFIPYPAPGSNCISAYERFKFYNSQNCQHSDLYRSVYLPLPSRPNRASDTKFHINPFDFEIEHNSLCNLPKINSFKGLPKQYKQLIIFTGGGDIYD